MTKLLSILKETRPENNFENSADFLEDNLLDSLDIVTILSEIETICGIEIDFADIEEDDFASVDSILELVKRSGGDTELLK